MATAKKPAPKKPASSPQAAQEGTASAPAAPGEAQDIAAALGERMLADDAADKARLDGDMARLLAPCKTGRCAPGFYQGAPGCERCKQVESKLQVALAPEGGPDRGTIPVHARAPHPGPMPKEPEGAWPFGLSRLTAFALARDRAGLQAFSTINLPPAVGIYRAELLEWMARVEAYEKAPKH